MRAPSRVGLILAAIPLLVCTGIATAVATSPAPARVVTGTPVADSLNESGLHRAAIVIGLAGNDTITGSTFNDTLDGGPGNDTISGGDGVDVLIGGFGQEIRDRG